MAFQVNVWDACLLDSTAAKPKPPSPKDKKVVYRMFDHSEDSWWARSRRSFHSASDGESDSDASTTSSRRSSRGSIGDAIEAFKSLGRKKGVFSNNGNTSDSGDESGGEDVKPSLFGGFGAGSRKPSSSSSPVEKPSSPFTLPRDQQTMSPRDRSSPFTQARDDNASSHRSEDESIFKDISRKPSAAPPSPHPLTRSEGTRAQLARSGSEQSLSEKYGALSNVLGKGAFATVKLCCPVNSTKKYAVKEFRKKRREESQKDYVKKLIAEFCISSSLDHVNVVSTVDLIQDSKHAWCVVMEYCAGGDLFSKITSGNLHAIPEINCYFAQLVRGVTYLHTMGVAHRGHNLLILDLKPENLLLDSTSRILKITDFGVSEVFRTPMQSTTKLCRGLAGSGPYIGTCIVNHSARRICRDRV